MFADKPTRFIYKKQERRLLPSSPQNTLSTKATSWLDQLLDHKHVSPKIKNWQGELRKVRKFFWSD